MLNKTIMSVALLAIGLAGTAPAQSSVRLAVRPDSRLWIEGTSNVHNWECKASTIDAAIDADAGFAKAETGYARLLKRVEVKVPVGNLKCGHGKMDDNLQKALRASDAPQITYILGTFDVTPGQGSEVTVRTTGSLTIAGKTNPVKMNVAAVRQPDGTVKAEGSVPVLMSDYGVEPPTALFGRIKAGNQVTVKFELLVGPQTVVATAGQR